VIDTPGYLGWSAWAILNWRAGLPQAADIIALLNNRLAPILKNVLAKTWAVR
jgi:hypothetical protein